MANYKTKLIYLCCLINLCCLIIYVAFCHNLCSNVKFSAWFCLKYYLFFNFNMNEKKSIAEKKYKNPVQKKLITQFWKQNILETKYSKYVHFVDFFFSYKIGHLWNQTYLFLLLKIILWASITKDKQKQLRTEGLGETCR